MFNLTEAELQFSKGINLKNQILLLQRFFKSKPTIKYLHDEFSNLVTHLIVMQPSCLRMTFNVLKSRSFKMKLRMPLLRSCQIQQKESLNDRLRALEVGLERWLKVDSNYTMFKSEIFCNSETARRPASSYKIRHPS